MRSANPRSPPRPHGIPPPFRVRNRVGAALVPPRTHIQTTCTGAKPSHRDGYRLQHLRCKCFAHMSASYHLLTIKETSAAQLTPEQGCVVSCRELDQQKMATCGCSVTPTRGGEGKYHGERVLQGAELLRHHGLLHRPSTRGAWRCSALPRRFHSGAMLSGCVLYCESLCAPPAVPSPSTASTAAPRHNQHDY